MKKKKLFISIVISTFIALLLLTFDHFSVLQFLELKLFDIRMKARTPIDQDRRILYAEMDETAIQNIGRWPWSRDINANLVDTLLSLGAKQIVFDVTFAQPSPAVINQNSLEILKQDNTAIADYLKTESENLKSISEIPKEQILHTIDQIHLGVQQISEGLNYATQDNDQIFAQSLKHANILIGYKFDIIYNPKDIILKTRYENLKAELIKLTKESPETDLSNLPSSLINNPAYKTIDIKTLITRSKIHNILDDQIETNLDSTADKLKINRENIRSIFYSEKEIVIRQKLKSALSKKPDMLLKEFIWENEIFEADTVKDFQKIWDEMIQEKICMKKFGFPTPQVNQQFYPAISMEPPLSLFSQSAGGAGFLNGIPDSDGVLRSVPTFINYENVLFPHIAIDSAIKILQPTKISFIPNKYLILHGTKNHNGKKDIRIPINSKGEMIINWAGPWQDTFEHVSLSDVYRLYIFKEQLKSGTLPLEQHEQLKKLETELTLKVKDHICIVGLTAPGTHDYNPIPFESAYPMVGTHGNILNSILTNHFITKTPYRLNLAIIGALIFFCGILLSLLSSISGFFVTLLLLICIWGCSLFFFNLGWWVNTANPLLLCLFSYLGITSYKFATEEKEKRFVKKAFSQYVAPEVMEDILKDPSMLQLGGVRKPLTVLFSDIRGFTTYSEKHIPEEVVKMLNEYLDAMTQIIFQNKGTLDKYVGDAIMAFFGAPRSEPVDTSAKQAVITAWQMINKLHELQNKWISEGKEPFDIGIGINTGDMVVGNMGSSLRKNYTVIGDAVNLGSRIESLTRQFNNHVIISDSTYQLTKDIVTVKSLETITVKGKSIPVMIYEVLDVKIS